MGWQNSDPSPFEHQLWLEWSSGQVQVLKERARNQTLLVEPHVSPLSSIIDRLPDDGKPVHVLDLGGGVGQGIPYLTTRRAVRYTIVDGLENCATGSRLFASDQRICFQTEIPDDISFDIVVLNGVLQYIEHWQALIAKLCDAAPHFVYLSRIPVHIGQTHCGQQEIAVGQPPMLLGQVTRWIFQTNDLITTLGENGYDLFDMLTLRDVIIPSPLGNAGFAQAQTCLLIFRRRNSP